VSRDAIAPLLGVLRSHRYNCIMSAHPDFTYAQQMDAEDKLARFRAEFISEDPDLIYLDGNSLGRLPRRTQAIIQDYVDRQWGQRLIRGWNEGWLDLGQRIGDKIARLIGAQAGEIVVAESTSTNLFKLAVAALTARPGRRKIVTDDLNFPSDLYIFQGIIELLGGEHELVVVPSPDGIHGPVDALASAIDAGTALVSLSHTAFKSAYTYDMGAVTALAHEAGALALWDLSHSAGAVPVDLNGANADLAVGCTYKYLNGGPGAPAFLYVRRDLQDSLRNPVSGWFGQTAPFDFGLNYRPAAGLRRMLTGTPPVLSLAAIEPGVDLLLEAGMGNVHVKSVQQTEYLIMLYEKQLQPLGFQLNSPRDAARRGSHVSFGHPDGWRINRALIEQMQVLPDFRAPDSIRLGVTPLYTAFDHIRQAVQRLRTVVEARLYEQYPAERPMVT
jgi:kynureninase